LKFKAKIKAITSKPVILRKVFPLFLKNVINASELNVKYKF